MSDIEAIALVLAVAVLMLLMLLALVLTALFHEIKMRAMWRNAYHDVQDQCLRDAIDAECAEEEAP